MAAKSHYAAVRFRRVPTQSSPFRMPVTNFRFRVNLLLSVQKPAKQECAQFWCFGRC